MLMIKSVREQIADLQRYLRERQREHAECLLADREARIWDLPDGRRVLYGLPVTARQAAEDAGCDVCEVIPVQ